VLEGAGALGDARRHEVGVQEIEHEPSPSSYRANHAGQRRRVFFIGVEVAEAREEIEARVHRARTDGERPDVGPYERRVGDLPCLPQQRRREVDARHRESRRVERPGVPTRTTADVEHAPVRAPSDEAAEQRHQMPGVLLVAVRIERQVLLTEPLFEPFGHRGPGCALVYL
jgi:hypothetical protein